MNKIINECILLRVINKNSVQLKLKEIGEKEKAYLSFSSDEEEE